MLRKVLQVSQLVRTCARVSTKDTRHRLPTVATTTTVMPAWASVAAAAAVAVTATAVDEQIETLIEEQEQVGIQEEDEVEEDYEPSPEEQYMFTACEKMKVKALRSRMNRFLISAIEDAGCPVSADFFQVRLCGDASALGALQVHGGPHMVLCADKIRHTDAMTTTISHELIHAYDHCRAEMDWTDLHQHACSEIRAASLSGECNWAREILRGNFSISNHLRECARRRAVLSVKMNPNCESQEQAEDAVADVLDLCMNDTAPFEVIP